jgi:hypothetical protein
MRRFLKNLPAWASPRQPLISRAMEAALMAEPSRLGNDEPRNYLKRRIESCREPARAETGVRMTIPIRASDVLAHFRRSGGKLGLLGFAILALAGALDTAEARSVRSFRSYDGTWNVVFITRAGNCSSTNSAPFLVSGRRLYSAGGGKVTGGISASGHVAVRISLGLSAAAGTGQLVGNSGAGRWSGIISGDRCSGTWQATRS